MTESSDSERVNVDATESRQSRLEVADLFAWFTPNRAVVIASFLVTAVGLYVVTRMSTAPAFYTDELGTIGSAYLFANPLMTWTLSQSGFMPGMAVLVTPLWWLWDSPGDLYRAAIVLGALLSLLSLVPLAEIARKFGAPYKASWILSVIVVLAPGRLLNANYVWSEQLLFLLVACAVALILRGPALSDRAAVVLGFVGGALVATHGRAAPFALGLMIASAWAARSRLRSVVLMAVASILVAGLGFLLYRYVVGEIYAAGDRVGATLENLQGVTVPGYFYVTVGQLWYQASAWMGLTVLGGAILLRRAWRLREQWIVFLVPTAVAVAITPILIADSEGLEFRLDAHFYGRYLDPFVAVLALLALVRLLRPFALRYVAIWTAVVLSASVLFYLVVVPAMPVGQNLSAPHVPGVSYLLHPEYAITGESENWLRVVLLALVPFLALVLGVLLHRKAAVMLAGAWLIGLALWTDTSVIDRFEGQIRSEPVVAQSLHAIDPSVPLFADYKTKYTLEQGNRLTYWLTPRPYYYLETTADTSEVLMFLGAPDSDFAREQGARPYEPSRLEEAVVWIMPGPLSEALDERGVLGPPLESTP